ADLDLVIVENVGNLVCPAEFEVGEHAKVALLSVDDAETRRILSWTPPQTFEAGVAEMVGAYQTA
ncbi:MAG: hypothetical protein AAF321_01475, partial [Pseudomonadota bacterium]